MGNKCCCCSKNKIYIDKLIDDFTENNDSNNLLYQDNSDLPTNCSLEDFKKCSVIGKGSFGKVYLVQNKQNLKYYAMKELNKEYIKNKNQFENTKSERIILEKVNHPFIVKLIS